MRVDSIKSYYLNTNINKTQTKNSERISYFAQKPDVFFRAAKSTAAKNTALKMQQKVQGLFSNPDYKVSAETMHLFLLDNSTIIHHKKDNHFYTIPIKNKHQLNFIKNLLAQNITPEHPIIAKEGFDNCNLESIINEIKTKEQEEALSCTFNFCMKHPEILDENTIGGMLFYNGTKHHKKFLEFIDKNYDDIKKKPDISNRHLENYIFYPLYHIWCYRYHSPEEVEEKYEKLWNVTMGKCDVIEAFRYNMPKDIDVNSIGYIKHEERQNDIIYNNQNTFVQFKAFDLNEHEKETIDNLNRITNENKINIAMRADDILSILRFDKNISAEELIFIDKIFDCYKEDDRWDFKNSLLKMYDRARNIGCRMAEKVDYNENNHKFLIYMANQFVCGYPDGIKGYTRGLFLKKQVLESIQTPEQLRAAKKLYNYYFDEKKAPVIENNILPELIGKYNLSGEDLIKIEKEMTNSKGELDCEKRDKIIAELENGTFKRTSA